MKNSQYSRIIFVLYCIAYGMTDTVKYTRDNVKVVQGTYHCLSNCSQVSAASSKQVPCSIDQCPDLSVLSASAPSQGLDIEDVHFEKFMNKQEDQLKLALYIKWSPIDNASIKHTKGYKVNITDGETSYSTCYSIQTTLNQSNNKDEYHNDCFGKETGTIVKIGSTIRIEITSLPLAESDSGFGRKDIIVEVPDCDNSHLHALEECQTPGGRPTDQPCEENCNTFSIYNGTKYPISCSISKKKLSQSFEPCPAMNRTVLGRPSHPKHVRKDREWYKFIEPVKNDPTKREVKLALRFFWAPRDDSSIKSLTGYSFTVDPIGNNFFHKPFHKCFSIHTHMDESHTAAEFSFDCYGRQSGTEVHPGESYRVTLQSRSTKMAEVFDISIPTCANKALEDVTECINDGRVILSEVQEIYCNNRSVRFSYFVSPPYGNSAIVRFCERGINPYICKNVIMELEDLELSGTLYSLSLKSNANLSIPYVISVSGNDYSVVQRSFLNFTECIVPEPVSGAVIAVACVAVMVFFLSAALVIWWCFFRDKCGFWIFKQIYPPPPEIHVSLPLAPNATAPANFPEKVCAYVVFAEDHEYHKRVVHWFCSYLKRDLGIDVKIHIWEENDAAANRPEYMLRNLRQADRVIVICSEGTRNAMNSAHETSDNMYAPIIRRIVADSLAAKNPAKYLVAHFSYSSSDHVPELLRDSIKDFSSFYNLMDDLEKFYFRLVGVEQYQDGGILKINEISRYFIPEERSDCGRALNKAINDMSAFISKHPTWYTDDNGVGMAGPSMPKAPSGPQLYEMIPVEDRNITDGADGQPSISYLQAEPPPELPRGVDMGARPKVKKNILQQNPPPRHEHRPMPDQPIMNFPRLQQPYQNGVGAAASQRQQPRTSLRPVGNHAQRHSERPQPTQNSVSNREPCEHSTMPDSAESSFQISDTEDLTSTSPSAAPTKPAGVTLSVQQHHAPVPPAPYNPLLYNPSFHPESFNTSDFASENFENNANGYLPANNLRSNALQMTSLNRTPHEAFDKAPDSQILTFLPSNATDMTGLGDEAQSSKLQELDSLIQGISIQQPSNEKSQTSGLFTLANVDEEELDLDDQIKSINLI